MPPKRLGEIAGHVMPGLHQGIIENEGPIVVYKLKTENAHISDPGDEQDGSLEISFVQRTTQEQAGDDASRFIRAMRIE